MDLGKGVLAEIGRVPELAANCSQGKVQMLYTYIRLNLELNLVLFVIECYLVLCIYIEANG